MGRAVSRHALLAVTTLLLIAAGIAGDARAELVDRDMLRSTEQGVRMSRESMPDACRARQSTAALRGRAGDTPPPRGDRASPTAGETIRSGRVRLTRCRNIVAS